MAASEPGGEVLPSAAAEEGPHAPNEERDGRLFCERLGEDGLPPVGARLKHDDPLCAIVDETTGRHTLKRHKYTDEAVVEIETEPRFDTFGEAAEFLLGSAAASTTTINGTTTISTAPTTTRPPSTTTASGP